MPKTCVSIQRLLFTQEALMHIRIAPPSAIIVNHLGINPFFIYVPNYCVLEEDEI